MCCRVITNREWINPTVSSSLANTSRSSSLATRFSPYKLLDLGHAVGRKRPRHIRRRANHRLSRSRTGAHEITVHISVHPPAIVLHLVDLLVAFLCFHHTRLDQTVDIEQRNAVFSHFLCVSERKRRAPSSTAISRKTAPRREGTTDSAVCTFLVAVAARLLRSNQEGWGCATCSVLSLRICAVIIVTHGQTD